jgi:hypothetical protein
VVGVETGCGEVGDGELVGEMGETEVLDGEVGEWDC